MSILYIANRNVHLYVYFHVRVSTVSDKNKLGDVNFRKFTGVIVASLIKISKFYFAENFMHKTKCCLNVIVRLVHYTKLFLFCHWLI